MKKVYTKTGDKGQTGLITGERLSKSSLIFEVLGTLDEFNASLGKVVANYDDDLIEELEDFDLKAGDQVFDQAVSQKIFLIELQRELFNLGERIDKLHSLMDKDWQSKFVLPGGSELSAEVDLARTVCRRLERRLVALDGERDIRDVSLKIINRVSDYLFVLRTWINKVLKVEENIYQSL
jgi:cob(I)alamin adenosyltransferase